MPAQVRRRVGHPPHRKSGGRERAAQSGFALIEIVCVLAVMGLIAALVFPAIPRATSRSRLEGYAIETAAVLKADRTAAQRRGAPVATQVSAETKMIRSGANGRTVRLPADVAVDTLLASSCAGREAGSTIDFFPSGLSCGGVVALARPGMRYEIRVNWLTGGVEIVSQQSS